MQAPTHPVLGRTDAGSDPAVVGKWITETQARKLALETRLRTQTTAEPAPPRRMTKQEINAIVTAITDLMSILRAADPADKSEVYTPIRQNEPF